MAAHLKPLSREEREDLQRKSAEGKVIWNRAADDTGSVGDATAVKKDDDASVASSDGVKVWEHPRTCGDFIKTWRSIHDYHMKWKYLKQLIGTLQEQELGLTSENSTLARLCKEEVPIEIFSDLIQCLLHVCTPAGSEDAEVAHPQGSATSDWKYVLHSLHIFSQSRRFRLTMSFMNENDKQNLSMIMTRLRLLLKNSEDVSKEEISSEENILSCLFNGTEARYFP